MDDAEVVRGRQPLRGLARVIERFPFGKRPLFQTAAERLAFQQLRDDVRRAAEDARVVDGKDIRMIELAGRARFLLEAMHAAGIRRERLRDQLDRHVAPETRITRAVHIAHPAGAEPAGDLYGPIRVPMAMDIGKPMNSLAIAWDFASVWSVSYCTCAM